MIYDEDVKDWVAKCPEHDNEILHSDDNGIVICIRFNNEKEEDKPEAGKVYALTGGRGARCIANGNTWKESVVPAEHLDPEDDETKKV